MLLFESGSYSSAATDREDMVYVIDIARLSKYTGTITRIGRFVHKLFICDLAGFIYHSWLGH